VNPLVVAALVNQVALPELTRWLAELHAEGRVVSEAEALSKLGLDVDGGNAAGLAFLQSHPVVPKS
jgi:hypothetical protein